MNDNDSYDNEEVIVIKKNKTNKPNLRMISVARSLPGIGGEE